MRRRFDHLAAEISIRVGRVVPRYPLWLRMRELGLDPEWLAREEALRFCEHDLEHFLRQHGLVMGPREWRRLFRAVARHDPSVRTPAEWAADL